MMIVIPGKPTGKGRARTCRNQYTGKSVSYTPDKTANYENLVKMTFVTKYPNWKPTEQPITMTIVPRYRKTKGNKMSMPMLKPDIDNCVKVVADALNGIAYVDDKQIVALQVFKKWCRDGEAESVTVTIDEYSEF